MSKFIPLIATDQITAGKAVRVEIESRHFIVSNDSGRFYVTDCSCPHEGAPLGGGDVRDGCIVCPMHYWPWDLNTGLTDPRFPELRLQVYPCEVRDGVVHADLSAGPTVSKCELDVRS